MSSRLEPAIPSCDTGQRIPCFDSCRVTMKWNSHIKFRPHGAVPLPLDPILDPRALLFCAWPTARRALGNPGIKLFHYLLLVETKKTLLIGQSVTRQNSNVRWEGCPCLLGILCLLFMQITDRARNRKMSSFRKFLSLQTSSKVQNISS